MYTETKKMVSCKIKLSKLFSKSIKIHYFQISNETVVPHYIITFFYDYNFVLQDARYS